jgi:hypothetical protein
VAAVIACASRAIPWGTSFRTLPHTHVKHPKHAKLRHMAGSHALAVFAHLAPAHFGTASGFFMTTIPLVRFTWMLRLSIWCFAKLEDADAFCQRFAGEHLPVPGQ